MNIPAIVTDINQVLPDGMQALSCDQQGALTLLTCWRLVQDHNDPAYGDMHPIIKKYVIGYIKHFILSGSFRHVQNASAQKIVQEIKSITTRALIKANPGVSLEILCAVSMVQTMGVNPLVEGNEFLPKNMTVVKIDTEIVRCLEAILESAPNNLMDAVLAIFSAINEERGNP